MSDEAQLAYEARDFCKALRLFKRAAEHGDPKAQFMLARMYEKGQGTLANDAESAIWCRAAADRGLPRAMRELGLKHLAGRGMPPDAAQGLAWLGKAAALEDSAAMHILGDMYARGNGVRRDPSEAARWFRKEAEATGRGSWELGRLHEEGLGVPRDYLEAYLQYSRSVSKEFALPSELEAIERARSKLTPEQAAEAERRLAPPKDGGAARQRGPADGAA